MQTVRYSQLRTIGKQPRLPRESRPRHRQALTVDSVDWSRAAEPCYHQELSLTLGEDGGSVRVRSDCEAQTLTRLVASMLRLCAPETPRWFRAGVLDVLQNARLDEATGLLSLTNDTPLDVVSAHSAYCYRARTGVAVTPPRPRPRPPGH